MNKFISLIRRAPKRSSALAVMLFAAIIVPAVVFAWGPTRDTFTIEKPADHVTFNSITNNPNIGDERNFVGIREVGSANTWYDDVTAQEGKEYYVRMYVHNNAASSLNLVAHDVTAKFNLPTTTGQSIRVDGFLDSSNATPNEVYDSATFNSSTNFNLSYVSGSLKYENNYFGPNGTALPESIFTSTGAKLGYDKLDGNIPGCFQYAGYVTFIVKPQFAKTLNFTTTKEVSKHGANQWTENYQAQPGETVDYLIQYKNTGTAQNDDVTFRDTLPTGLTYVANSGTWTNPKNQNVKFTNDASLTNGTGVNVGSYATGGGAYVIFSAKVASEDQLACGVNTLVNKAKVNTGGYAVEDTANVTVNKDCKPTVKYTCDALNVITVDKTHFKFNTTYTAENATFKSVTYVVKNAAGTVVDTKTSTSTSLDYTQATVGKYTVQATVTFTVDGQEKTATSEGCKGSFEVKETPPVVKYTCDALNVMVVDRTHFTFTTTYTAQNATFKGVTYTIKDASGKIVDTITATGTSSNYTQTTAGKYTVQAAVIFNVNGQDKTVTSEGCKAMFEVPSLPSNITVCELATKTLVTINEKDFNTDKHSKDLSKCASTPVVPPVTPPVTPPELPHTGMTENIVAIVGLGAIVASVAYYIASRRALNQ
jgi:uncharacterized repeat protein (TIGR01451 family)